MSKQYNTLSGSNKPVTFNLIDASMYLLFSVLGLCRSVNAWTSPEKNLTFD